ncbi:MAG: TolC family protein [Rhodothermales bacterium]
MISLLRRLFLRPRNLQLIPVAASLAVMLLLTATSSRAQAVRTITFEEAVNIALNQNLQLRRAESDVELQTRQVFQERMDFLPNLTFSSGGSRGSGFAQDQAGRNIQFSTSNVNGQFSTGINLFNGFADVASLEQAKYMREASEYTFDRTRQDVVFNVINNFLLYVNARERVQIQQENVEAQRRLVEQIEEFVNVGSRPISDLYQQQAAVAQAELQVLDAERTTQLNMTRLIQVLHLDPFGNYEFAAPELDQVAIPRQDYDVNLLLQNAFEQRADIHAQEETILAAREGIRISKASYYPSINFGGNYRSNFSLNDETSVFDQIDINRGNSIGFNISYPIFDRFSRGTDVQRSEVQYQNALLDLESTRQSVALQVRQAYLDYLTTEKRVQVTEVQERAASQALQAAEERYNVGAGTLVELTQARATFIEASLGLVQARYEMLFQRKLVDYYVGRLNPGEPLLGN